ncbi:DUF3800 domain-containing protein [Chitinimonas arctica]|uniref:DUF3800 domain-containing protein n=1 Tax=Chitinimonas arctica TaxID=2594795 RepID=A0A516SKB7_9NEIS|nr:DUF3800 domain-containing protein [Chitinimonas arctica]QDQ28607.1 DUF3800 domain-containing protein [Chitinimonas arctica]
MYLLYLDDSGSPTDKSQQFFVMGGICVFERQTHWLDNHLTPIAARFDPAQPENVELHANPMRSGSDGWKRFSPSDRVQAVVDALHLLSSTQLRVKVFAAVIEKQLVPNSQHVIPMAFEAVATQFDGYLASRYHNKGEAARGLVIFDRADFENNVQFLSHHFKHAGHANGKLRNFAEVPLFIDSKASRLIQLADLVAYWIFRRDEAQDARGFDLIAPYLHSYGGQQHGLCEHVSAATKAKLMDLPAPQYPFPQPSGLGVVLPPVQQQH